MLTLRKRGRVYHVRGSVRLGGETRRVEEHSTGCDRREDAEAYRARLEHDVRQALLHGGDGKTQGLTIADAGLLYMNKPGGVKPYDLWRLGQLNDVIGDYPIAKAAEGWGRFKQARCGGLAPATVQRFRATLAAALNYAAAVERFAAPNLGRTERVPKKRIRFLTRGQEARLLGSYASHAPALGGPRIPCRGPRVPEQAGEAVRRPTRVQAARRQPHPRGPPDRVCPGRDRRLPCARLATPLGLPVRNERDRPRDYPAGRRVEVPADGRAVRHGQRGAPRERDEEAAVTPWAQRGQESCCCKKITGAQALG
jgi:hypothetical protein